MADLERKILENCINKGCKTERDPGKRLCRACFNDLQRLNRKLKKLRLSELVEREQGEALKETEGREGVVETILPGIDNNQQNIVQDSSKDIKKNPLLVQKIMNIDEMEFPLNIGKKATLRPVIQYNIDGTFMNIFKTANEAGVHHGIVSSLIISVCNNKKCLTAGNFQWRWVKENDTSETVRCQLPAVVRKIGGSGKGSRVAQYSLEGDLVATFEKILDAARSIGIKTTGSQISNVAKGRRETAHGYKWRYVAKNMEAPQKIEPVLFSRKVIP